MTKRKPSSAVRPRLTLAAEARAQRMVQCVLAAGSLSRIELARALKVVASTVSQDVDRLIEAGLLYESASTERTAGRPPIALRLNPDAGQFIGIDFDARQMQTVAVDVVQQPIGQWQWSIPKRASSGKVIELLIEAIQTARAAAPRPLLGIGLAAPGDIDPVQGSANRYPFFADWQSVPIVDRIRSTFAIPVAIENNLRAAALAEWRAADEREVRHLVLLGIRSGIGVGMIIDGRLHTGGQHHAGNIRHWIYQQDGQSSHTVEDLASLTTLLAQTNLPSVDDLRQRLDQRDTKVESIVQAGARVHAWIAHQLALLLDPDRLVMVGPLTDSAFYRRCLDEEFRRLGRPNLSDLVRCSTLGPYVGARGAADLAFRCWKPIERAAH